jgi:hypothetical protein
MNQTNRGVPGMKERRPSGEPVLAEVGPPVILSLGVAGYLSVMRPWVATERPGGSVSRSGGLQWKRTLAVATFLASVGCASVPSPKVETPAAYLRDPPGWKSPTGESEAERYRRGFHAYWWNCVGVKGLHLEGRCPFVCSGTPGATQGCADGAAQAEEFVAGVIRREGAPVARQRLASWAASRECRNRTKGYFPDGPRSEAGTQAQ